MADTDNTQDNDDGSVYWTLGEAIHWIAFFCKEPPPDDARSVATFDQAERALATAYKSGKVRLFGRDGEFSPRKEIPVLQLSDPHFDAAGNAVYQKPEPWDGRGWIDVCLDRQEVLAEWPDPHDGSGVLASEEAAEPARTAADDAQDDSVSAPTKAATNKMFEDLHRKFFDDNSRPAIVNESYTLARSIGVTRDRARLLRRGLPSHLKNKRRRPSQK